MVPVPNEFQRLSETMRRKKMIPFQTKWHHLPKMATSEPMVPLTVFCPRFDASEAPVQSTIRAMHVLAAL